jgi:hypothetical protein
MNSSNSYYNYSNYSVDFLLFPKREKKREGGGEIRRRSLKSEKTEEEEEAQMFTYWF